jgi:radical SAM protein with 4Fe4S-binding SPASM domain
MVCTIQKNLSVYVKTTETCNLNCFHCFTSGTKGAKIYFDPEATADWCNQLYDGTNQCHFEYHGGEPMLAPVKDLWTFYHKVNNVWGAHASFGITTNLTFKLTEERIEFLDHVMNDSRIGTSWDPTIRFSNEKQRQLWEDNVKILVSKGFHLKAFISVSKDVCEMSPRDIAEYMMSLGIYEISWERITGNGNALLNGDKLYPTNTALNDFFMRVHTENYDLRDKLADVFMDTVYHKFERGRLFDGTFCRDCEQKLFTINADGTIAGCPNSAPTDHYGHINNTLDETLNSTKRNSTIAKEMFERDSRCYECPVFAYCHSDCHQLEWQDDVCPAPKTLMMELLNGTNNKTDRSV